MDPGSRGNGEKRSLKPGDPGYDLARHYPSDVLVTGFDIIFFWIARMMMQGIEFMGEPPFHTVYCHGLVRDAKGAKMSKSKGNTVDPLALIDKYGADALRFTLTAMESQGRDIKLDEKRVEGYRNFATKLWNAARFCQSNGITGSSHREPPVATQAVNRWIIGEVVKTAQALDAAVAAFRFDVYAETAYQFVWGQFCDLYIEWIKPFLIEGFEPQVALETRAVAGWALDQILVMLHPVMPFITEELWHKLGSRSHDLIVATWPTTDELLIDQQAYDQIQRAMKIISDVRVARSELNIPWSVDLHMRAFNPDQRFQDMFNYQGLSIGRIARIKFADETSGSFGMVSTNGGQDFDFVEFLTLSGGGFQIISEDVTLAFPLKDIIDLTAERARLDKAAAAAEKDRDMLTARLASPGFSEKAKPEAVDKARADLAARTAEAERLRAALARLG